MFVTPNAPDALLQYISGSVERLVVCSQEPSSSAQADTVSLGSASFGPADVSDPTTAGGGRQVTYAAKTGITVNNTGEAVYVALLSDTPDELLVASSISNSQTVTAGNTMDTSTFTHTVVDPA